MTNIRTSLVAAALVVLAGASLYLSRLGATPDGQPAAVRLDSIEPLRAAFNQAADTTRVLLILSPTCPYCLKGATVTEEVLARHAGEPLTVFVLWQPFLPTDWGEPGSSVMSRMPDTRIRQFWDPDNLSAQAINALVEAHQTYPDCCYDSGLWWDLTAVFEPGALWEERLPAPALINGTIEDAAPALDQVLTRLASGGAPGDHPVH